jgi:ABC-type nitrate/sulfonate/bicarbonate transport system permease component/ABC-type nitrate/sulfonate/bicarbonate transport system ATPase subunit
MTAVASKRRPRALLGAAGVLLLLLVWTVASLLAGSYIVPTPWSTVWECARLIGQARALVQILITFYRVAAGFLLALAAGSILGVAAGLHREVEAFFRPLTMLLQGVPPLLWAIPLILVLGTGRLSPILVIALICFPLVAVNLAEGMSSVPGSLSEMLRIFAPGLRSRLRELILPHLRPFLMASLKLGIVTGIKASVIAEYFGANNGIGFQIQAAYQSLQVRRLFAWGLILILLIVLTDRLLRHLESGARQRLRGAAGVEAVAPLPLEPRLSAGLAEGGPRGGGRTGAGSARAAGFGGVLSLGEAGFGYPGGPALLEGIGLTVEAGQVAIISGDSGIGKTTLLHLLAGLLEPDSGRVERPERLGIVFQDDRLLPWSSNAWNVAMPLVYAGFPVPAALGLARGLLEEVGLAGLETGRPGELSGGMRKRLSLARCFAGLPDAILLDEPFTGLDAEARRFLWQRFMELLALRRVPVVIVTHFPEEVPAPERCTFYTLAAAGPKGSPARLLPTRPPSR